MRNSGNLFDLPSGDLVQEFFETIFEDQGLKIERIISQGNRTAEGKWLEQDRDEWVLVVQGSARIAFKDKNEIKDLNSGEYILIPAYTKHRVDWTDPKQKTIWLAVHGKPQESSGNQ